VRFLESKKDFLRYPYNATYWYELNTKKPPLDNVLVRRALNLAMDKNALVQHVTRGPVRRRRPTTCPTSWASATTRR
jgi:ABC-type oligopeptide transport system substrate-binding subunit